ncbi:type II toxin-antitoxin system PemK/MazF family toxin [Marinactinospora thermotolerans]|uniref:PemK-like, MazF-like toxin of type II toxin-antitoxin system n=1 Tax=Marinactinospora thermotolerans DSM 45154 TaxID=1122192 RepID=A0A1T4JW86_9ACTN|nr:type II toxin-antitoxin system PemK/MazF family toxin [Marinactinospora thermotolerans]SJZ34423.1 PemK-like, MazF-like toxin of type II toxin-antitoxin system [Marinactinospora thermotolerans DSM 45154]
MLEPRDPSRVPAGHPHRGAVREVATGRNATVLTYAPDLDGRADAGEIVWTWVPYEEDPTQGKDRPLLVVGRRGPLVHALMLSSRTPDGWEEHDWLELGSGTWDRDGRRSYVRLDRLFELDEDAIRREGAVLEADRFWHVGAVLRARYGWR